MIKLNSGFSYNASFYDQYSFDGDECLWSEVKNDNGGYRFGKTEFHHNR